MAFDVFLKIEGIDGESTDSKHQNWIEILAYSHGTTQFAAGSRSSGGAASGGRCDHQDFTFTKTLDKATPKLLLHCCNGKHIPSATLQLNRATGDKTKFMEYKLEDIIVSSLTYNGATGMDLPGETVSFNYGKITWTYTETDHKTGSAKGNVTANWSVVENTGS
jgi:type VI secretion system secreted protein Hcp